MRQGTRYVAERGKWKRALGKRNVESGKCTIKSGQQKRGKWWKVEKGKWKVEVGKRESKTRGEKRHVTERGKRKRAHTQDTESKRNVETGSVYGGKAKVESGNVESGQWKRGKWKKVESGKGKVEVGSLKA